MKKFENIVLSEEEPKTTSLWIKPDDSINMFNRGEWKPITSKPDSDDVNVSDILGKPNGIAELDDTGKVPSEQLPSYVDDIVEYDSFDDLPSTGEQGKLYVTTDNNIVYRWSGSTYTIANYPKDLKEEQDKLKDTVDYLLLGDNNVEIDFEKDFAVLMKDNTIKVYKDIDWSEKGYSLYFTNFRELYGSRDSECKFKQILSLGDISGATEGFVFYASPDVRSKFPPVKDKIKINNGQALSFCQFDDYSMFDYSLLVNPWCTFCGTRFPSKTTFDFYNLTEANLLFYSAIFEQANMSHSGDNNTEWGTMFRGWNNIHEEEFVVNAPELVTSDGLFQNASIPGLRFFSFSFPKLEKATSMFRGAVFTDNPALDISLPKATNVDLMFAAANFNDGFLWCGNLSLPEATSARYMFNGNTNVTVITALNLPKLEKAKGMFATCPDLKRIECTFGPLSGDGGIDMFKEGGDMSVEIVRFNLSNTTKASMFNIYLPNLKTLEITGLKCDIDLSKQVNLSVKDVKFLFENAQTVTNKTIILPSCINELIDRDIKTIVTKKGWSVTYSNISNDNADNKFVRKNEFDPYKIKAISLGAGFDPYVNQKIVSLNNYGSDKNSYGSCIVGKNNNDVIVCQVRLNTTSDLNSLKSDSNEFVTGKVGAKLLDKIEEVATPYLDLDLGGEHLYDPTKPCNIFDLGRLSSIDSSFTIFDNSMRPVPAIKATIYTSWWNNSSIIFYNINSTKDDNYEYTKYKASNVQIRALTSDYEDSGEDYIIDIELWVKWERGEDTPVGKLVCYPHSESNIPTINIDLDKYYDNYEGFRNFNVGDCFYCTLNEDELHNSIKDAIAANINISCSLLDSNGIKDLFYLCRVDNSGSMFRVKNTSINRNLSSIDDTNNINLDVVFYFLDDGSVDVEIEVIQPDDLTKASNDITGGIRLPSTYTNATVTNNSNTVTPLKSQLKTNNDGIAYIDNQIYLEENTPTENSKAIATSGLVKKACNAINSEIYSDYSETFNLKYADFNSNKIESYTLERDDLDFNYIYKDLINNNNVVIRVKYNNKYLYLYKEAIEKEGSLDVLRYKAENVLIDDNNYGNIYLFIKGNNAGDIPKDIFTFKYEITDYGKTKLTDIKLTKKGWHKIAKFNESSSAIFNIVSDFENFASTVNAIFSATVDLFSMYKSCKIHQIISYNSGIKAGLTIENNESYLYVYNPNATATIQIGLQNGVELLSPTFVSTQPTFGDYKEFTGNGVYANSSTRANTAASLTELGSSTPYFTKEIFDELTGKVKTLNKKVNSYVCELGEIDIQEFSSENNLSINYTDSELNEKTINIIIDLKIYDTDNQYFTTIPVIFNRIKNYFITDTNYIRFEAKEVTIDNNGTTCGFTIDVFKQNSDNSWNVEIAKDLNEG